MDWIPIRTVEWEEKENGRVILFKPKFRRNWLARLTVRLGGKPDLRIHLDETGSVVWTACDGCNTVWQICQTLQNHCGEADDTLPQRTVQFLQSLLKRGCICFRRPA